MHKLRSQSRSSEWIASSVRFRRAQTRSRSSVPLPGRGSVRSLGFLLERLCGFQQPRILAIGELACGKFTSNCDLLLMMMMMMMTVLTTSKAPCVHFALIQRYYRLLLLLLLLPRLLLLHYDDEDEHDCKALIVIIFPLLLCVLPMDASAHCCQQAMLILLYDKSTGRRGSETHQAATAQSPVQSPCPQVPCPTHPQASLVRWTAKPAVPVSVPAPASKTRSIYALRVSVIQGGEYTSQLLHRRSSVASTPAYRQYYEPLFISFALAYHSSHMSALIATPKPCFVLILQL